MSFGIVDQVNDTLGHASGERLVTLAARRLDPVSGVVIVCIPLPVPRRPLPWPPKWPSFPPLPRLEVK